jgi:hypothetical protein
LLSRCDVVQPTSVPERAKWFASFGVCQVGSEKARLSSIRSAFCAQVQGTFTPHNRSYSLVRIAYRSHIRKWQAIRQTLPRTRRRKRPTHQAILDQWALECKTLLTFLVLRVAWADDFDHVRGLMIWSICSLPFPECGYERIGQIREVGNRGMNQIGRQRLWRNSNRAGRLYGSNLQAA